MLKSTKGCRLKADSPTIMRAVGQTGLTSGAIDLSKAHGKRGEHSPTRKPLPAYKRTAGKRGGRTLTAAQARAERMRGQ